MRGLCWVLQGGLLPLVPVLRLAGLRAEGASRTAPLPAPPGNASLGLAVSAIGLQVAALCIPT
jgi:hypothetical protein